MARPPSPQLHQNIHIMLADDVCTMRNYDIRWAQHWYPFSGHTSISHGRTTTFAADSMASTNYNASSFPLTHSHNYNDTESSPSLLLFFQAFSSPKPGTKPFFVSPSYSPLFPVRILHPQVYPRSRDSHANSWHAVRRDGFAFEQGGWRRRGL